jgi:hypothetical protein
MKNEIENLERDGRILRLNNKKEIENLEKERGI